MNLSVQDSPRLPPAYRLVSFESCASTNDEAKRLANEGAEDGTLIWAKEQLQGRGRLGRGWSSPPGNLYLSMILRPDCALGEAAQLGYVTALALGDAVGSVAPPMIEVTYKWPNDVLFNDRKGAGILLESNADPGGQGLDWLIVGMGVNLQSFPENTERPATSLRFEGAPPDLKPEVLLESFSRHFLSWVNRWLEDGFEPLRKAWRQHARFIGEEIQVRLPKETLEGRFIDIDSTGALILELTGGLQRTITAGEIFALQQNTGE